MRAFYSNVLKLPLERSDDYRAGKVPFPSVRLNSDTIIDLFPKGMWEKAAREGQGKINLNRFCIALAKTDWEELRKCLETNAVVIEAGPVTRWGAHGTGISMYFRDPENDLNEARYYEGHQDSRKC